MRAGDDKPALVKCGALWRSQPTSNAVATGEITIADVTVKIVIVKNRFKTAGSKEPDLRILASTGAADTSAPRRERDDAL